VPIGTREHIQFGHKTEIIKYWFERFRNFTGQKSSVISLRLLVCFSSSIKNVTACLICFSSSQAWPAYCLQIKFSNYFLKRFAKSQRNNVKVLNHLFSEPKAPMLELIQSCFDIFSITVRTALTPQKKTAIQPKVDEFMAHILKKL
jgi:hypothetical protein